MRHTYRLAIYVFFGDAIFILDKAAHTGSYGGAFSPLRLLQARAADALIAVRDAHSAYDTPFCLILFTKEALGDA